MFQTDVRNDRCVCFVVVSQPDTIGLTELIEAIRKSPVTSLFFYNFDR